MAVIGHRSSEHTARTVGILEVTYRCMIVDAIYGQYGNVET